MLLLLALAVFAAAQYDGAPAPAGSGATLCDTARQQWEAVGAAVAAGKSIESPNVTPAENANARRRFRVLQATIRRCQTADGRRSASKNYRKPYNGRRTVIHKRNGRRQYAVRRANGRFQDIQDIGRASRMDQRRTRLETADRIEGPAASNEEY